MDWHTLVPTKFLCNMRKGGVALYQIVPLKSLTGAVIEGPLDSEILRGVVLSGVMLIKLN